jgi:Domain of unknown function (DUF4349)
MNTEIRFLQQLEGDLRDAASREHAAAAAHPMSAAPRRLPRRGRTWSAVAAAFAALLVLAGSIGFLAQNGGVSRRAASEAVSGIGASATPAPPKVDQGHTVAGEAVPGTALGPVANPAIRGADVSFGAATSGSAGGSTDSGGVAANDAAANAPQTDLSKIIRDGKIGIQVGDQKFTENAAAITRIAQRAKGTVMDVSTQNESSGTFTLRIPSRNFDEVMLQLRALGAAEGASILYTEATGKDVTANFIDLQARLSILQGTKARLVDLQSKATTTSQILYLGNQIDQVQLQIEQIQGQLNVIRNQVAESTVTVELREENAPENTSAADRPSLGSAWDYAVQGFMRVLGAVIVGLGYLIPVAVIGLAIGAVVMLVRKRRRGAS